jgi:hypothetical protein
MFDNFEPWVSIPDQGKLLKNSTYLELRAYLGWSIETCCLISYLFIVILCTKISCVTQALPRYCLPRKKEAKQEETLFENQLSPFK